MICFRRQLLAALGVDEDVVAQLSDTVPAGSLPRRVLVSSLPSFGECEALVLQAEPAPRVAVLVGLDDHAGVAARTGAQVEVLCRVSQPRSDYRLPTREEACRVLAMLESSRSPGVDAVRSRFARIVEAGGPPRTLPSTCESPDACRRTGNCQRWMRDLAGCSAGGSPAPASSSTGAGADPATTPRLPGRVLHPHAQSFRIYGGVLHLHAEESPRTGHAWYVPGEPGFSSYDGDVLAALDNLARALRHVARDVEQVRDQVAQSLRGGAATSSSSS